MNIGVFGARAIPSTYSGYETFLTSLLPALVRRGHRVTMYCRSEAATGAREYEGVALVSLPAVETKQLSTLSHGVVASIVARTRGHDVVFVVNVANVPCCFALRATGQRCVLNTDGQEWLRGKWGVTARSYFKWCARHASSSASALVSDCAEMQRIYADEFGADSVVIPYPQTVPPGIDVDVLSQYGLTSRRFVVVAARLNPENNVDLIAQAFSNSTLDCPLLVLGVANYDSEVARRLEDLARRDDRIRLLGHVGDRPAFASLLRDALAYVHGHSVGGMNPSLVEAMSVGAAVLALDTPFNREVVGDCGLYFEADTARLAALFDVVESADLQPARERAKLRAATRFSAERVTDAYELLFTRTACLRSSRERASLVTSWDTRSHEG